MNRGISHDRNEETMEAKAIWFQSLSLQQRMELLCSFTDLALALNPGIADCKNAEPVEGRIRVLNLEDVRMLESGPADS